MTESDYHDFEKILEIVGLQEDLVLLSPPEQTTFKIYYNGLISDAIASINCEWRTFIQWFLTRIEYLEQFYIAICFAYHFSIINCISINYSYIKYNIITSI